MTASPTPQTIDRELAQRLRARGQRVTSQRLVINRLLRERDRHVTADEVFTAISDVLPGTSLPTVYATLELFEQLGIVRRVHTGGGTVLFDTRTTEHHHLVCRECGKVEDLDTPVELSPALARAQAVGFAPERVALVVEGRCAACAARR
jgi:Fe2+ or Zn2+ uptake regulation protein